MKTYTWAYYHPSFNEIILVTNGRLLRSVETSIGSIFVSYWVDLENDGWILLGLC